MGCCVGGCATSPDRLMDMEVSKEINGDRDRAAKIQKLLFLGSGGSGKSTFFKQLRCIHGSGFSDKDRRVFKEHISAQIIEQINRSVECIPYYNERLPPDFEPLRLSTEGQEAAKEMENIGPECLVNSEIAQFISILWNEEAIQEIYKNRAIYHIDDSSSYFFQSILRIGDINNYLPTDMDILYVRYRTTGVIESKFSILGSNFHIFDVGGQQSERKKWIHCFENVTAVIFVASLSCYDELMFEDDTINCMVDSLQLFKEICNLQWFVTTPIILFLNKKDLFENKIHIIPLSVCFNEYDKQPPKENSQSSQSNYPLLQEQKTQYMCDSRNYIKAKFVSYNNNTKQRQIYVHITCATDKNNVQNVFNDVQQIVVSAGLERNNLI
jgi:GTPase SAR1 family protein